MNPKAVGRYLRESRESQELTLDEAVQKLRMRRDVFESFERGEFDVADTPVRVRGMLRNYARFLNLDEETVLGYYEASQRYQERDETSGGFFSFGRFGRSNAADEPDENAPRAPRRITDTPPSLPKVEVPRSEQGDLTFGERLSGLLRNVALLLVSVAALAVIGFVIVQTLNVPDEMPIAQQPTALPLGAGTPTLTRIFTSTPQPTSADATLDFSNFSGVDVDISMTGRSWMRVLVDDNEAFVGILEPGDTQQYQGNSAVRLTVANAAAVEVVYNGQQQEPLGVRGQQVQAVFSTSGVDVQVESAGEQPTFTPLPPTATRLPGFPTDTPAPPTATPLAPPSSATPVSLQPPTATSAPDSAVGGGIAQTGATPTPLFGNDNTDAATSLSPTPTLLGSSSDAQAAAPTQAQSTAPEATAPPPASPVPPTLTLTLTVTPTLTPTITPSPVGTPTPTAILPIRATSTNLTPTKQP